jgi:hypothetical protein
MKLVQMHFGIEERSSFEDPSPHDTSSGNFKSQCPTRCKHERILHAMEFLSQKWFFVISAAPLNLCCSFRAEQMAREGLTKW